MTDDAAKEQAEYEARLQRRLKILRQQLEDGKISFAPSVDTSSILKVRLKRDGEVDLDTVDASVRALALGVEYAYDRDQLKSTCSLSDIQKEYFLMIEVNFGEYYQAMLDRRLNPHDIGMSVSQSAEMVSFYLEKIEEFLKYIDEFWMHYGPIAIAHVEDFVGATKAVYGGDLFPSAYENIASKCGLYTDTIILPDPFLRSKHVFEKFNNQEKVYYLIKHAMNILQYRDLACMEIRHPIAVVLPDMHTIDENESRYFLEAGRDDAVKHAEHTFGREFGSMQNVIEFCTALDTTERVVSEIKDSSRVFFSAEDKGSVYEKIEKARKISLFSTKAVGAHPGLIMASHAIGRMAVSNEVLIKSHQLRGVPVMDAETSWKYLVWKLEYDAIEAEKFSNLTDLHVVHGLQALSEKEMRWLGKIPASALMEIRKSDALGEIREILRRGIDNLILANPSNFFRSADLIFKNIDTAFEEHQRNIEKLTSKRWKFAGVEIGSWVVVGSLAITAAATGSPSWGLAAIAADQLLDAPKLKNIPKSIRQMAAESVQLRRSPVGLLFSIRKHNPDE